MGDALQFTGVEYFVGRVHGDALDELRGCPWDLWVSPKAVPYTDAVSGTSKVPIRVMDVRSCSR